MKLLLLIVLLAIFSTSDAYGFLQKEKGKNAGKQKRGVKFAKKVVPSNKDSPTTSKPTVSVVSTPKPATIKPVIKQQTMAPDVKSKVNKLQLLEKQHYNGNRELLIQHLQKQIALKKKEQIEQQNQSKIDIPAQSQNTVKSKKQRRATSQPQVLKDGSNVKQNEIRQPANQDTIVQVPNQQQNMQVQQSVSQPQQNLVQQNFNQVSNNMQLQAQQNQYNQQNVQVSQQMQQQSNQQQHIQQQQQQQQQLQQQPQQQTFVQQSQRPVQQLQQQQPQNNIVHNFNHIEQSFLPQQELMQLQAQFQNRNNVQPQMQKQSMAVMQPMNVIKQQNAAYQTSDHSQSNSQQTRRQIQQIPQQQASNMNNQHAHVQIQQLPQQQSSNIVSQMQPMNQMVPRQHILMPLNSLSMDPVFQPQMVLPERYVFLNNGGTNNHAVVQTAAPPVITTKKPTTTLPPPTTPKPTTTTTRPPTTREPGGTVQNDGGDLQYQFFQKEMKKQDLEIMKLRLEIRALKRAEHYVPKEIEMERRTNAPPTKPTTIHPFLAFGQKKFPFDF